MSPGWWGHRFSVSLISDYCSSISSSVVPCSPWCPISKMNTFAFYCLLFVGSFPLAKNNTLVFFYICKALLLQFIYLFFNEKILMLTQLQMSPFSSPCPPSLTSPSPSLGLYQTIVHDNTLFSLYKWHNIISIKSGQI